MNRTCTRLLLHYKPPSALLKVPIRRCYHPEPRSFQNSAHGTHRFIYRWTIQAVGTPFAIAYLCGKISGRSDGESSFKLELPDIDSALLTEPIRVKSQVWGHMRVN
ncbi:uncharacterized protein A1O5_07471 [Cladophialophora psammophila CBS 110553]|uniref:Uncharacterized protein n=1 Tax=Cladophialophora psammophila CBS 110553 TaxID=1182543 RepID=W9WWL9_9EURO|nr:uncharacterized protein A1O5_07471 [Cladophialophora psammophila CBS 110553]EXJ69435.1 hypothetical protein A1O5_07471 [Cladophialophora psammophila CBS 110553]